MNEIPSFSERLRQQHIGRWDDATRHRFVRELGADTLSDGAFARYLVLDYAFIEHLVSLVGHAVAVAPDMTAKVRMAGFLGVLTSEENDFFLRAFEAMDLPPPSHESAIRHPVLDGFRSLIAARMAARTWLDTLAVLLPVEWVYLEWAREAARQPHQPSRFYLKEWIDLHADEGFAGFVGWVRDSFDVAAARADDEARSRAGDAFAEALRLEVAFFDAAYEGA